MFTSNGLMCFCGESMCRIGMASLIFYLPRCLEIRAPNALNRGAPVAPPGNQNFEPIGSSGFDCRIIEACGNFFRGCVGKARRSPRTLPDPERTPLFRTTGDAADGRARPCATPLSTREMTTDNRLDFAYCSAEGFNVGF